jgi:hypothetical protein
MLWGLAGSRYKITRETRVCQKRVSVMARNFISPRVLTTNIVTPVAFQAARDFSSSSKILSDLRDVRTRAGLDLDGVETGLINNPALDGIRCESPQNRTEIGFS